ncbi:MAG: hypothetical protein ACPGLV_07765, partial [Bacteroidia bacterium]
SFVAFTEFSSHFEVALILLQIFSFLSALFYIITAFSFHFHQQKVPLKDSRIILLKPAQPML